LGVEVREVLGRKPTRLPDGPGPLNLSNKNTGLKEKGSTEQLGNKEEQPATKVHLGGAAPGAPGQVEVNSDKKKTDEQEIDKKTPLKR